MKRSNEYGFQTTIDSHKKQRYSPQTPYGYPNVASPAGYTGPDMYGFPGGYMGLGVMNGMGGMTGGQFPPAHQFAQGGYPQYSPGYGPSGYGVGNVPLNQTMRTIYLGNLPPLITYEEVINLVKGGTLEQVKVLEDKNCAFVTFVDAAAAQAFHSEYQSRRLHVGSQEIKVGWGKHSTIPSTILGAIQSGASRNVFIGNIDETITEATLQNEFGRFGAIDQIKILAEKRIAFVHMASIAAAIKAVNNLPNDPRWANRRINYGRDRCAYQPKMNMVTGGRPSPNGAPVSNGGHGMMYPGNGHHGSPYPPPIVNYNVNIPYDPFMANPSQVPANGINRTVYLGSIHPDVTTKDLCDVIRGGILQNIKYMPDKNIAFVTFVDPNAAVGFYNRGMMEGVVLKGKRLKIGWGKPSSVPTGVATAVSQGASRNVYIGAIDDQVTEDRLRKDFADFGDIELVNIIPDKNIGFVNFVDIMSAVKAVENMKGHPDYAQYKINYGKDRCGNPPRPPRESAAARAAAVAAAAAAESHAGSSGVVSYPGSGRNSPEGSVGGYGVYERDGYGRSDLKADLNYEHDVKYEHDDGLRVGARLGGFM
ncbi:hypothetical protein HDU85_007619 [Gaertneriomyces sp. JEL0708]|nr:hypothetical protein HDU85_007619 [Gaertneriomyces sp. JEL0708]